VVVAAFAAAYAHAVGKNVPHGSCGDGVADKAATS
jgi:hypothetical protein